MISSFLTLLKTNESYGYFYSIIIWSLQDRLMIKAEIYLEIANLGSMQLSAKK